MRILGGENLLIFDDNVSGGQIGLKYRMPTTAEIISFRNGGTKNVDGKLVSCMPENRLTHGLKILTGVRDGDFGKPGPDGEAVAVSSDKLSADYDANWKELVGRSAGDLVEMLGFYVFEASAKVKIESKEATTLLDAEPEPEPKADPEPVPEGETDPE